MTSLKSIGFIETILAENGCFPFLDLHLQRLQWSLWQYGISQIRPLTDLFLKSIENAAPAYGKFKLRCLLNIKDDKPEITIETEPLPAISFTVTIGIFCHELKQYGQSWNGKTNEREVYVKALEHARSQGWDDAIVLSYDGSVADACIYNIFILKDDVLFTPSLSSLPVKGVMREWIKRNAVFPVVDAKLYPEDLKNADYLLVCNAIRGIIPARLVE